MGLKIDLDDCVAGWPDAKAELVAIRGERDELLAAGKLALARLCDGCYFETRDCPGNPEGCEAVRTLRAAIAKAELSK